MWDSVLATIMSSPLRLSYATPPIARTLSVYLYSHINRSGFNQNGANRVKGGLERSEPTYPRSATRHKHHPDLSTRGCMEEVRRPFIGVGYDSNPIPQRRVIVATGAHIGQLYIAGRSDPFCQ